jgi:hypothetical protein
MMIVHGLPDYTAQHPKDSHLHTRSKNLKSHLAMLYVKKVQGSKSGWVMFFVVLLNKVSLLAYGPRHKGMWRAPIIRAFYTTTLAGRDMST